MTPPILCDSSLSTDSSDHQQVESKFYYSSTESFCSSSSSFTNSDDSGCEASQPLSAATVLHQHAKQQQEQLANILTQSLNSTCRAPVNRRSLPNATITSDGGDKPKLNSFLSSHIDRRPPVPPKPVNLLHARLESVNRPDQLDSTAPSSIDDSAGSRRNGELNSVSSAASQDNCHRIIKSNVPTESSSQTGVVRAASLLSSPDCGKWESVSPHPSSLLCILFVYSFFGSV